MPSESLAVRNAAGLEALFFASGGLRTIKYGPLCINLFVGNAVESGATTLVLRRWRDGEVAQIIPLLGPTSVTRWILRERCWQAWHDGLGVDEAVQVHAQLLLSPDQPVWTWRVTACNLGPNSETVDLVLVQDVGLASYDAVRVNEFYVSQYLDHTPLQHPSSGTVLLTRQNLPNPQGRYASLLTAAIGGEAAAWATDASQVDLTDHLPARRLQGEHAVQALQHVPCVVPAGASVTMGFACGVQDHHPEALGVADLPWIDAVLLQAGSTLGAEWPTDVLPTASHDRLVTRTTAPSLFDSAPVWPTQAVPESDLLQWCEGAWRHEERHHNGQLLSFFYGNDRHVVTMAKEQCVLRPHGHLLRTGDHLSPDENSLTSTLWMAGTFNSMVTEGHVSSNRLLSTVRGYVGGMRSAGQRVFIEQSGQWHLLHMPSAFEMHRDGARWLYFQRGQLIEVAVHTETTVRDTPLRSAHALKLSLRILNGKPCRFLVTHQVALQGDDGLVEGGLVLQRPDVNSVSVYASPGSAAALQYGADAHFTLRVVQPCLLELVSDDSLLFADRQSRGAPMVCLQVQATSALDIQLESYLLPVDALRDRSLPALQQLQRPELMAPACGQAASLTVRGLNDMLPWFEHNALVHYLAPRGLEQYAGGGWGTRDVSQGPVELLLSQGCVAPVRDLLLRVFAAQDASGDWPQWFMFFARNCHVRAGDSHGDIVFWPLLALGQYLQASGDDTLLHQRVPFYPPQVGALTESESVWVHVQRALHVIATRRIDGTALAAYGHGDWNDSLQPADPQLREHMCGAWTVTLHHQMLKTLTDGLQVCGWSANKIESGVSVSELRAQALAVERDFQRHLLPDGVLAGYALFDDAAHPRYLLHPLDTQTGAQYSLLPMIHAVTSELLTPEQAQQHLALIRIHLLGPDGARLFDKPLAYRGGPTTLFQRAESSSYFGREIGLMYMHAHLRWAEALAHMGRADDFLTALAQANPIDLQRVVPQARLRQCNTYSSSSDGVFADRYEANAHYDALIRGEVALEAGWRVYSSGAGIALGLVWRCLLGLRIRHDGLDIDPVMPMALNGLEARVSISGQLLTCRYQIGAAGHGVTRVDLNGHPLAFIRQPNRYRPGAVRIAWTDWEALMVPSGEQHVLTIYVG